MSIPGPTAEDVLDALEVRRATDLASRQSTTTGAAMVLSGLSRKRRRGTLPLVVLRSPDGVRDELATLPMLRPMMGPRDEQGPPPEPPASATPVLNQINAVREEGRIAEIQAGTAAHIAAAQRESAQSWDRLAAERVTEHAKSIVLTDGARDRRSVALAAAILDPDPSRRRDVLSRFFGDGASRIAAALERPADEAPDGRRVSEAVEAAIGSLDEEGAAAVRRDFGAAVEIAESGITSPMRLIARMHAESLGGLETVADAAGLNERERAAMSAILARRTPWSWVDVLANEPGDWSLDPATRFDEMAMSLAAIAQNEAMPDSMRVLASAALEQAVAYAARVRPHMLRRFGGHMGVSLGRALAEVLATPVTVNKIVAGAWLKAFQWIGASDETLAPLAGWVKMLDAPGRAIESMDIWARAAYVGFDPATISSSVTDASMLGRIAGEFSSILATLPVGGIQAARTVAGGAAMSGRAMRAAYLSGVGAVVPHAGRFAQQNFDEIRDTLVREGASPEHAIASAAFHAPFGAAADIALSGLPIGLAGMRLPPSLFKPVIVRALANAFMSGTTGAGGAYLNSLLRALAEAAAAGATPETEAKVVERLFGDEAMRRHSATALVAGVFSLVYGGFSVPFMPKLPAGSEAKRIAGVADKIRTAVEAVEAARREAQASRPAEAPSRPAESATDLPEPWPGRAAESATQPAQPAAAPGGPAPSSYAVPRPSWFLVVKRGKGGKPIMPAGDDIIQWIAENPASAVALAKSSVLKPERFAEVAGGAIDEITPARLQSWFRHYKRIFNEWARTEADVLMTQQTTAISVIRVLEDALARGYDPVRPHLPLTDAARKRLTKQIENLRERFASEMAVADGVVLADPQEPKPEPTPAEEAEAVARQTRIAKSQSEIGPVIEQMVREQSAPPAADAGPVLPENPTSYGEVAAAFRAHARAQGMSSNKAGRWASERLEEWKRNNPEKAARIEAARKESAEKWEQHDAADAKRVDELFAEADRMLREAGFTVERGPEKGSRSVYYEARNPETMDRIIVRVSDHEVPETPQRAHRAQYGGRPAWQHDAVLAQWSRGGYRPIAEALDGLREFLDKIGPSIKRSDAKPDVTPDVTPDGDPETEAAAPVRVELGTAAKAVAVETGPRLLDDPVAAAGTAIALRLGVGADQSALIAGGLRTVATRTANAVSDDLATLRISKVLAYDGPKAEEFSAMFVPHGGSVVLVVNAKESGAAAVRKWALHETMHEIDRATGGRLTKLMGKALDEISPGLRTAIMDRYYARMRDARGEAAADEYRASGDLEREVVAVLSHDMTDALRIEPGEALAPADKDLLKRFHDGLVKSVRAAAKAFGAPASEADALAANLARLTDPTRLSKRLATAYGVTIDAESLRTINGALAATLMLFRMHGARVSAAAPAAVGEPTAGPPPTPGSVIARLKAAKLSRRLIDAAEEYFAPASQDRRALESAVSRALRGNESAARLLEELARAIGVDELADKRFESLLRRAVWFVEPNVTPASVKSLLLRWGVDQDLIRSDPAPFAVPGLDPGLMERIRAWLSGRRGVSSAQAKAVHAQKAVAAQDVGKWKELLVNPVIAAMTASKEVRRAVERAAVTIVRSNNETVVRADEIERFIGKVAASQHDAFVTDLDRFLDPDARASSREWAEIERTRGRAYADALEQAKRFIERMRIEKIQMARRALDDALEGMSIVEMVRLGNDRGSPHIRLLDYGGPVKAVVDILTRRTLDPATLRETIVRNAVPDDWGYQWRYIHHSFNGRYEARHDGSLIGHARSISGAAKLLHEHWAARGGPKSGLDPNKYEIVVSDIDPYFDSAGRITPAQRRTLMMALNAEIGSDAMPEIRKALARGTRLDLPGSSWDASRMPRIEGGAGWSRNLRAVLLLMNAQHVRHKHWHKARRELGMTADEFEAKGLTNAASLLRHMIDRATGLVERSPFEVAINGLLNAVMGVLTVPARLASRFAPGMVPEWLAHHEHDPYLYRSVVSAIRSFNALRQLARPAQAAVNSTQPYVQSMLSMPVGAIIRGAAWAATSEGRAFIAEHGIQQPVTYQSMVPGRGHMSRARAWLHKKSPVSPIREWANHDMALAIFYRHARDLGLSHETALDRAIVGMIASQFTALPGLVPKGLDGPTRALILQFKPFFFNTWGALHATAKGAQVTGGLLTPMERVRRVAAMQGALMLAGGVRASAAMPVLYLGYALLSLWRAAAGQEEDAGSSPERDMEAALDAALSWLSDGEMPPRASRTLTRLAVRGLPSLAGADLSGQMAIYIEPIGNTPVEKAINFLGGVTLGSVINYSLDRRRVLREGLDESSFVTLGSTLARTSAAWRAAADTVDVFGDIFSGRAPVIERRDSSGALRAEITGLDTLWASLGMRTIVESETSDTMGALADAAFAARRTVSKAGRLLFDGDYDGAAATIGAWNEGLPAWAWITWDQVQASAMRRVMEHAEGNRALDRAARTAGRSATGRVIEEGRDLGPGMAPATSWRTAREQARLRR